jgi:hypothetical protein
MEAIQLLNLRLKKLLHHKKVQKKLFSFAKGIVQHAGEA